MSSHQRSHSMAVQGAGQKKTHQRQGSQFNFEESVMRAKNITDQNYERTLNQMVSAEDSDFQSKLRDARTHTDEIHHDEHYSSSEEGGDRHDIHREDEEERRISLSQGDVSISNDQDIRKIARVAEDKREVARSSSKGEDKAQSQEAQNSENNKTNEKVQSEKSQHSQKSQNEGEQEKEEAAEVEAEEKKSAKSSEHSEKVEEEEKSSQKDHHEEVKEEEEDENAAKVHHDDELFHAKHRDSVVSDEAGSVVYKGDVNEESMFYKQNSMRRDKSLDMSRQERFEDEKQVDLTVGRIEDGSAYLLTEDFYVIDIPCTILPKDLKPGNMLKLTIHRNIDAEEKRKNEILNLQNEILEDPNFFSQSQIK
mmetsp:Transcript_17876/g.20290  ORF Transcript_17876/g.20290 Transcript_17876/m.20290 type:complete len:366 (-) Transcript_17876:826-1923(-)